MHSKEISLWHFKGWKHLKHFSIYSNASEESSLKSNDQKTFWRASYKKEIIYLKLNCLSIDSEHNRLINTINTNKNRIKCSLCLCVIRKSFKINFWMHKSIIYTYCSVVCKAADCKIEIRKWNYKFCCMHLIE